MSLSKPKPPRIDSPIEWRYGINKELGAIWRAATQDERSNDPGAPGFFNVPMPFKFILLDADHDRFIGKDGTSRIQSNLFPYGGSVRITRYDGHKSILAEGATDSAAVRVVVDNRQYGIARNKCLLIFVGGKIAEFRLSGTSYGAWINATKDIDLSEYPAWEIQKMEAGKTSQGKDTRIPVFVPTHVSKVKPDHMEKAIEADKVLQGWLESYGSDEDQGTAPETVQGPPSQAPSNAGRQDYNEPVREQAPPPLAATEADISPFLQRANVLRTEGELLDAWRPCIEDAVEAGAKPAQLKKIKEHWRSHLLSLNPGSEVILHEDGSFDDLPF